MLGPLWSSFEEHGVTEGTMLELNYLYYAPNRQSAESLKAALEDKADARRSGGFFSRKWVVEGETDSIPVSLEFLGSWLVRMVGLGWQYGCEFDGFEAEMPDP